VLLLAAGSAAVRACHNNRVKADIQLGIMRNYSKHGKSCELKFIIKRAYKKSFFLLVASVGRAGLVLFSPVE
jgi:hypothetical protein